MQTIGIIASERNDMLRVFYHNLTKEARIYLDGALALTIMPDVEMVALRVRFGMFEAISSLSKEDLTRGGDWTVTTCEGRAQFEHASEQACHHRHPG